MSFSINRKVCVCAIVLAGLLYGSTHVSYDRSEGGQSLAAELAPLSPVDVLPTTSGQQHAGTSSWKPSLSPEDAHSDVHNFWKDHNVRAHRALQRCRIDRTCTEHQEKVVLLDEVDYRDAYRGTPGGEKIYARSLLRTFDELGVTYFFSFGSKTLATLYSTYEDLVRAVIMNAYDVQKCWDIDAEYNDCLKTPNNPHGVPVQLLFSPDFFGSFGHNPLGREWCLVPEDYEQGDTYIGYSVEHECMQKQIPAYADRPRQVWILAKRAAYFHDPYVPVTDATLLKASKQLNIEFKAAFLNDSDLPNPTAVTNLGDGKGLSKEEFEDAVVNSLAIVGIGNPWLSPSPWYAMCWSIPFLNPNDPDDQAGHWGSQHPPAGKIGEPHVYNYFNDDEEGFIAALAKAIEPHDRFVPEHMSQPAMNRRVLAWLERDWKALAEEKREEPYYKEKYKGKEYLL